MKIKSRSESGSVLMAALIMTVILMGLALGYSTIVNANVQQTGYNQDMLYAEYTADGGLYEVVAQLNCGAELDDTFTGDYDGCSYSVLITDLGSNYLMLESTGFSGDLDVTIETVIGPRPVQGPFTHAAFGDGDVTMSGQAFIDSYDSDTGTYASQAVNTDPVTGDTYANANGGVGSNMNISANGQVNVMGDANPGPGGSVSETGQVHINGSTDPAAEERELEIPTYNPTIAASGSLSGTTTLGDGTYRYTEISLASRKTVTINGDVIMYIDGKIKTSGQSQILINPGASLVIYQGDAEIQMSGQGIVNSSGAPPDLLIYSSSTSRVKLSGQADFYGAIYAPGAYIQYTGQADIFGAIVGDEIKTSGQAELHYDEALSRLESSATIVYEAKSWRYK